MSTKRMHAYLTESTEDAAPLALPVPSAPPVPSRKRAQVVISDGEEEPVASAHRDDIASRPAPVASAHRDDIVSKPAPVATRPARRVDLSSSSDEDDEEEEEDETQIADEMRDFICSDSEDGGTGTATGTDTDAPSGVSAAESAAESDATDAAVVPAVAVPAAAKPKKTVRHAPEPARANDDDEVDAANIIATAGRPQRARRAPQRYVDDKFSKRMFHDVPAEELGAVFDDRDPYFRQRFVDTGVESATDSDEDDDDAADEANEDADAEEDADDETHDSAEDSHSDAVDPPASSVNALLRAVGTHAPCAAEPDLPAAVSVNALLRGIGEAADLGSAPALAPE